MRFLFLILNLSLFAVPSMAVDWASCQSALENVKSQSARAADASSEAENAAGALNEAGDDLRNCRTYPDVYDLMGDHCGSKQRDVDSAKNSLDSAEEEVQSQLRRLRSALADAAFQCEFDLSVPRPLSTDPRPTQCERLRALRGRFSQQLISDYCRTLMPAEQCKVCLGF